VIGKEARAQILEAEGRLPDLLVACVGGGSNAIGLFYAFLQDSAVKMLGVEAGGRGHTLGEHAARLAEASGFAGARPGVLQGTYTYVLQTDDGQISTTHSVSAGLDYPAVARNTHYWLSRSVPSTRPWAMTQHSMRPAPWRARKGSFQRSKVPTGWRS